TIGQGSGKSVTATSTDAAGNASAASAGFNFSVGTVPPWAPVTAGAGEGGAIGGSDNTVSSQSGDNTVAGTAEANSTVAVKFGATTLLSATADARSASLFPYTALFRSTIGQGSGKSVTATSTDAAGNASAASTGFNF